MQRNDVLIEADELLAKISDPNLRIYDANILFFRKDDDPTAYDEYKKKHIAGAAFFDHDDFSDSTNPYRYMILPEADLMQQIGNIGISADSEVVVYTSGLLPTATRAWWVLHYAGHNNVRVLNGGLAAWEAAGGEVESGGNQYAAVTYQGQLRPEMFVGKDDVLAAMDNGNVCTVNTLSAESYEQGHITGSSLLSCMDLTEAGSSFENMVSFAADDILAERLKDEAQHERVITYCGGGIAATVNAMAHLIAGNENVAVYDGSMSEWGGEGLPITTGAEA